MILFDFYGQRLENEAESARQAAMGPWNPRYWTPVLLHIAGIDLLAANSDEDQCDVREGLRLPLLEVAVWGLIAMYHVRRAGESAYELNEHGSALLFRLHGDRLLVHSLRREKTVSVSYAALLTAWEHFGEKTREFLPRIFGPLDSYPWWNPFFADWFAGRLNAASIGSPNASLMYLDSHASVFDHIDATEA